MKSADEIGEIIIKIYKMVKVNKESRDKSQNKINEVFNVNDTLIDAAHACSTRLINK